MDPQEHMHIISAGERIHKTYPAVLRELGTVTHTFIFAEKEVYTSSVWDSAQKRLWKGTIRDAIDEVNIISRASNISCELVAIDAATFDAIRDTVVRIFGDHPSARFSFDISAGSKRLSLGLFSMSLWIEGDAHYAFGNSPSRRVPVPMLPVRDLMANRYHLVILTILFRGPAGGKEEKTLVPEETLFNETTAWQIPVRHTEGELADHWLSSAAFSRIIAALIEWNLIREESEPGNISGKLYRITPEGELALFVYSARMKKRGVVHSPGIT